MKQLLRLTYRFKIQVNWKFVNFFQDLTIYIDRKNENVEIWNFYIKFPHQSKSTPWKSFNAKISGIFLNSASLQNFKVTALFEIFCDRNYETRLPRKIIFAIKRFCGSIDLSGQIWGKNFRFQLSRFSKTISLIYNS